MSTDIIKEVIGKVIKLDRGGAESRVGMLLDASDDLIVLLTEDDGVVYYNAHHYKSVTDNMKKPMEFNIVVPEDFKFITAANFLDLLDSLSLKWVKINRGGPEHLEGIVTKVDKDFVCVVNSDEIVRVSLFHIKSISYGLKLEKAEEAKSETQESSQKAEKSNKSSNKKKNSTKNNKNKTSQKTTAEDTDMALAYPLTTDEISETAAIEAPESDLSIPSPTMETSQETAVEDDSDLSIHLSIKVTSQKSTGEDVENDLSVLLSTMEKFLRKYSKTKL